MRLTAEEISWINAQLKACKIPFREVYEEIYDHFLSAIEIKRNEGNSGDISVLFNEVLITDFKGCDGVKTIARERVRLVQAAFWSKLMVVIKQNRVLTLSLSAVILLAIGLLPIQVGISDFVLGIICFILAFTPLLYLICINGFKNVFTDRSVKLRTMVIFSTYAVHMFNLLFCVIFGLLRNVEYNFKARECNPLIYGVLLVFLMAYVLNFIRLYNYELK